MLFCVRKSCLWWHGVLSGIFCDFVWFGCGDTWCSCGGLCGKRGELTVVFWRWEMGQGSWVYFWVVPEWERVAAFVAAFFVWGQGRKWNKQRQMRGSFTAFRMTTSKGERRLGSNGAEQATTNTGVLHFVQDDDTKQATTQKQRRNAGIFTAFGSG